MKFINCEQFDKVLWYLKLKRGLKAGASGLILAQFMTEIGAIHEGQTSIESNYHGDSGQYQYDSTYLFMYFRRLSAG